jgi:tetratricopeptide (TPR) repeat protein
MNQNSSHAETPAPQNLSIPEALAQAHRHWTAGQTGQAEALCQKVLEVWPGNPDALHILGLIAYNWGNRDLALDYLRKACLSPAAPAVYFSNLAEMCRQQQLLAEGEIAARRAVALDANLVGGWNNLGIILQEMGKYDESLVCLERVIAFSPDYAEAYNNLGNTYKRLGRTDKAENCYGQALQLNPGYAEARSNFSNLLKDAGEYDRAAAEARAAIDLNPRNGDAYVNLAAVELARNNYPQAMQWVDALLAFAPSHVMALTIKSELFERLDNLDQSLEFARRAVAINPQSADAQMALGRALQGAMQYDEALAAFDKARGLHSLTPEQSHVNRATLLMEINRNDEAREAFAAARAINPHSGNIWFNLSALKTFTPGDPDIAAMEKLLAACPARNVTERQLLHFALGKAHKDTQDVAASFRHYDAGNRLKRASVTYDADMADRWIETIIETFTPDLMQKLSGAGVASDIPVFIVGMPRSGTTLLEQILAAHPQVQGAGELSTIQRLVGNIRGENGQLMSYPQMMPSLNPQTVKTMGDMYLSRIAGLAAGHSRVVDKMPANFFYAGLIALMFPKAKIIHCMRDAVDTCLSCYTQLFSAEQNFSYDLQELGRFYNGYRKLMAHWRALLPKDRFIEIAYEDVVGDIEGQARRIIQFCGLPWDNACLEFYKGNRRVRTASMTQVRNPVYHTSVGRWKRYEAHLSPLLKALGAA